MTDDSFTGRDWLRLLSTVAWLAIFVIWPQLVLAVTVLIVGSALIAFNLIAFWFTMVRNQPSSSVAPIFGGVLAAVGIALLPVADTWKWAWIPFVIDWGGLPLYLFDRYRGHPHQKTIDSCQIAANSVREQLGPEKFDQVSDYVSKHDEWLVGLEFAIDWLIEDETKISQAAYNKFEKAFSLMDREKDDRLGHLRALVSESDRN